MTHRQFRRRWWTLAALCLSLLVVQGGNSNVNIAIPTFARDLDATTAQLQWIVAAYSLAFAGLLFPAAAIADRYGRKGAVQYGLLAFLMSTILASVASEPWQIIVCRLAMGAAAAFILPSTLSILVNVFPANERGIAIALWAASTGIAGTIAPVVSGYLLEHYWFGIVFLASVPIIVLALVSGMFLIPKTRDPARAPLDLPGALLSIAGVSMLLFGIIAAPSNGGSSTPAFLAIGAAILILFAFVLHELRARTPMLDMRLFREPAFATGAGVTLLLFGALFGTTFLLTQYLQLVLGYSPLEAAAAFLPATPMLIGASLVTPRLLRRIGANRAVATGLTIVALGLVAFAALGRDSSYALVVLGLATLVSGVGLVMAPLTTAIMASIPNRRAGMGSATNDATRELGAALGVAILGSIAASRFAQDFDARLGAVPRAVREAARGSLGGATEAAETLSESAGARLVLDAQQAFVAGFRIAALVAAVAVVVAALIVRRWLPRNLPSPPDDPLSFPRHGGPAST